MQTVDYVSKHCILNTTQILRTQQAVEFGVEIVPTMVFNQKFA